jgi:uncharacterized protein YgiM (DUF1202 family)
MRLGTFLHIVSWPSLAILSGLLLVTPKDILRQPVIQHAETARLVAAADPVEIIPATLTVRATALPEGTGVPRAALAANPVVDAPTQPKPQVSAVDRRWITAGALNLRSGPSVTARLIASLPFGTPVEVIETSGNWAHVAVGDAEGWLSTKFLDANAPN